MKRAAFSIVISLIAFAVTTGTANAYCYNGAGYAAYAAGSHFSKTNAVHKAKLNWEIKARKALHTTAVYWGNASYRTIKLTTLRGRRVMLARARFCISTPKRVKRKVKCPPGDIRCKARNTRVGKNNKIPQPGVKVRLNPQPEPPSKLLRK